MDIISTRAMQVTQLALDGLIKRQQAIASNTANAMTPDYQRKDIVFEDQLQQMIKKSDLQRDLKVEKSSFYEHNSLDTVQKKYQKDYAFLKENAFNNYNPEVIMDISAVNPETGNNVNIEKEMLDMSKAGIQYTVLSTLQGKMVQGISDVIKSGSGG